jgi:hypothetical protein
MKTFKIMSNNLPIDSKDEIFNSPESMKILEVIDNLYKSGMAINFAHNCIAASDILQASLHSIGIKSKIIEVQLNVFRDDGTDNKDYLYIGYDGVTFPGEIDTHVVVITETKEPLLIDLSLGHILPSDRNRIITKCNPKNKYIASLDVGNLKLSYFVKTSVKMPHLHQKNLVERMIEDNKTRNVVDQLRVFIYFLMGLSIINFTLNSILLVLKIGFS